MTTITISLPDDDAFKLKERATRLGIKLEDLARTIIEDSAARETDEFIDASDERFKRAADYVLKKNAELYRRLA